MGNAVARVCVRAAAALLLVILTGTACAGGQSGADRAVAARGRILLVLPFDNRSTQPNLTWIREAAADLLTDRFASVGFDPMSRPERMYALDHLGLPQSFQPSRASSLKLAQTLDADSIIVGDFLIDGSDIVAEAQIVDVRHLRMGSTVTARGTLKDMISVFDSLAWKLTKQLDPGSNASEQTFIAAGADIQINAFEQYIRGITEPDQAERLRHLKSAVQLSPGLSKAWMALGRELFTGTKYADAANAFAKVGRNSPDILAAGFYRGLSLLFSGDYVNAEVSFKTVAATLPLAEVINNQGVAASRQGHDATALFRQAATAEPDAADYHFNLAVSLKHHGDPAGAINEMTQALKLRPNDGEADVLLDVWKSSSTQSTVQPVFGSNYGTSTSARTDYGAKADPLERIVRNFDEVAFRQAEQLLEMTEAAKQATMTPHDRAVRMTADAKGHMDRGLPVEAERLYQNALALDDQIADAHAGLAEIREQAGDAKGARKQANRAVDLAPIASAHVVLGRLDLAEKNYSDAKTEANEALRIDSKNKAAADLLRRINAAQGQK